ncbi:PLP-dependent aminotransferase family protein [Pseudomonas sp. SBB6]|uniref:aminotransferase-like domain-containing protein n=1 Tax=Pseudomonas sp. SBB6 TaxID=2962032 RepID=UPI0020B65B79|nr:PLP-dependent aminotransferase family protein [Pseudomonas sp. SBB6]MCP3752467.1 PLP-dependent aminotransferase family protein [Pseudomonas sp. SBB6]
MKAPAHGEFAYRAVYRYLVELIAQMAPGSYSKLPSLRDLAQRLDVSISTVQYAYSLLEHEGRVQPVPKSGYFAKVPALDGQPRSGGDLLQDLQEHANSPQMLVLSGGQAQALPSIEATLLGIERQLLRQYPRLAGAPQPWGDLQLRTALAARYTRSAQLYWSAEDVYLALDVRSLLETTLAALELHNSAVLVTTPCSWRLLRVFQAARIRVIELPLGPEGGLDLEQVARLLREEPVRLAMLSSRLSVPQGSLMPEADRKAMAQLLDVHGVWLLENDLEAELCFQPAAAGYLRELVDPQRLLVFSSLERSVGAEAPYAYLLSRHWHGPLHRQFLLRGFRLPPLRQQAVARLYSKGRIDRHLEQLRLRLHERLSHLYRQMQLYLGTQLEFQMPAGGACIWARVRAPVDTRPLFHRLLQQGLVIAPGELFSLRGDFRRHLRLGWPLGPQGDLQYGLSILSDELRRTQQAS